MEAEPKVGDTYNQEIAKDVAEDKGSVLSLNEKIAVTYGSFSNVLKTKDFSPLEPDIVENKYYAPNIGQIKAISIKGESEVETLTQMINHLVNTNILVRSQLQFVFVKKTPENSPVSTLKCYQLFHFR